MDMTSRQWRDQLKTSFSKKIDSEIFDSRSGFETFLLNLAKKGQSKAYTLCGKQFDRWQLDVKNTRFSLLSPGQGNLVNKDVITVE